MREAGGTMRAGGLCLSQTNKDTGCRMEIKNHSIDKLLHCGTDEKRPLHLSSEPGGCQLGSSGYQFSEALV